MVYNEFLGKFGPFSYIMGFLSIVVWIYLIIADPFSFLEKVIDGQMRSRTLITNYFLMTIPLIMLGILFDIIKFSRKGKRYEDLY